MASESEEAEVCAVCLEPMAPSEGDTFILDCMHRFHKECVANLNRPSCPLCRAPIKKEHLPGPVYSNIIANERRLISDSVQEESEAVRRMQASATSQGRIPIRDSYMWYEAVLALKYIYAIGIPAHLIPSIKISIHPYYPLLARWEIFKMIVRDVVKSVLESPEEATTLAAEPSERAIGEPDRPSNSGPSEATFDEIPPGQRTIMIIPHRSIDSMRAAMNMPYRWPTIRFDLADISSSEIEQLRTIEFFRLGEEEEV